MFLFSLQLLSETFPIERRISRDIHRNIETYSNSGQILMKLEFSQQIYRKNAQLSSLIKICPVGSELSNADKQTDTTKLIVAFRIFAKAPKNRSQFRTSRNKCSHLFEESIYYSVQYIVYYFA
jgi:hypothetical protein